MSKVKDSMFFEQVHISSESNRSFPEMKILTTQKEVDGFCGLVDTPRHHKESVYPVGETIQQSSPEPEFCDKLYSAAKEQYSEIYNKQQEFRNVAKEIADILYEKNEAYGSSFQKSGEIMAVLYPDGIEPSQFSDALTIVRIIDKLFRIANNKNAFAEDPWYDICGYAMLKYMEQLEIKKQQKGKQDTT